MSKRPTSALFAPFALSMLSTLGGCPGYAKEMVVSARLHDEDVYYAYEEWPSHEDAVVAEAAAKSFGCAAAQIRLVQPYDRAFIAGGCGHTGVFLAVEVADFAIYRIPGRDYNVNVEWVRVIDLAHPIASPLPSSNQELGPLFEQRYSTWVKIPPAGSKDLECPIEEIVPDLIPQGKAPALPVAEGCGKRATYLSDNGAKTLRLSSIVAIK